MDPFQFLEKDIGFRLLLKRSFFEGGMVVLQRADFVE